MPPNVSEDWHLKRLCHLLTSKGLRFFTLRRRGRLCPKSLLPRAGLTRVYRMKYYIHKTDVTPATRDKEMQFVRTARAAASRQRRPATHFTFEAVLAGRDPRKFPLRSLRFFEPRSLPTPLAADCTSFAMLRSPQVAFREPPKISFTRVFRRPRTARLFES